MVAAGSGPGAIIAPEMETFAGSFGLFAFAVLAASRTCFVGKYRIAWECGSHQLIKNLPREKADFQPACYILILQLGGELLFYPDIYGHTLTSWPFPGVMRKISRSFFAGSPLGKFLNP
jgi:hypothetical protein